MRLFLGRSQLVAVLLIAGASPGASQRSDLARSDTRKWEVSPTRTEARVHASLTRLVRLDFRGMPLERALSEIAAQAGLRLGYSTELLPANWRVTVRDPEIAAGPALERVLVGTGLEAVVSSSGHLALVPRRADFPQPQRMGTITGRVMDAATGAPLSGATVRIRGSTFGTLTATDGKYRLEGVAPGAHTLVASLIGYSAQEREVTVASGAVTTADLRLTVSAITLDQVVVTGTVTPTEVREIPTPITVITAEEIERRNVQRVDELFRGAIPGVSAPDLGTLGESGIRIRGSTVMTGTVGVKIYLDGIEVASPTHIVNLDPNSIERIEIIRGPQASTIYGSGAIDGVIQIFTKKGRPGAGRPVLTGQLALGAVERTWESGFAPRQDYALQVDGGSEFLSYKIGGSYQGVGDWLPEYGFNGYHLNGGARISQGPLTIDLTARSALNDATTEWNFILRDAGYLPWSRPRKERREIGQQTFGGAVTYEASPRWRHRFSAGYDGTRVGMFDTAPRLTTPADTMLRVYSSAYGMTSVGYNTTLDLPLASAIDASITGGIDHYTAEAWVFSASATTRTAGSINGPNSMNRVPSDNTGVYTQAKLGIADALFLTGGIRAERNSNFGRDFGTAYAPRAGIAYETRFGPVRAKLRGSYGEAIRPPNIRHQQETRSSSTHHLPNPDLRPERQRGWDAGTDLYFGEQLEFSVTRYDQMAEDLIGIVILEGTSSPIQQQSQNVGRVENSGWEMEGRALLLDRVVLTGAFSRMRSRVDQLSPTYGGHLEVGDQLGGVPEHTAGAMLAYTSPLADLQLEVSHFGSWTELDYLGLFGWLYGGEPFRGNVADYYISYPGFTKFSAGLSRGFKHGWEAYLRVDNLTDSDAFEWNNIGHSEGRTTTVGVRFRY